jgi:hypothetical protein
MALDSKRNFLVFNFPSQFALTAKAVYNQRVIPRLRQLSAGYRRLGSNFDFRQPISNERSNIHYANCLPKKCLELARFIAPGCHFRDDSKAGRSMRESSPGKIASIFGLFKVILDL